MITDTADRDHGRPPAGHYVPTDTPSNYRIELLSDLLDEQGKLLDQVISFAFDSLHVRVLDIRVVQAHDGQLSAAPSARGDEALDGRAYCNAYHASDETSTLRR